MTWVPATDAEEQAMLEVVGCHSLEDLFTDIPPDLRAGTLDLPAGLPEMAVRRRFAALARQNHTDLVCFLGGGCYDHFIPAAVDALTTRGEFATAYTPYQPECAQGTLQAIYEYQSAICRLTEMPYANASMYDGGTAVFEAALMAVRRTRRQRVVCHESLNPLYRQMLDTHAANLGIEIVSGDCPEAAACVIVQNPGFLGCIADYSQLAQQCHAAGALLVMSFYPVSLGLLKTPGAMGADIAVAEGQSLGMPLSFGGPFLGILATTAEHLRKMPGRIAAATEDAQGRRGYVLTMQAREQHIRREKAMSNICSNEALCALRCLVHLCLLGKEGLRETARHCHAKSEYLKGLLAPWATPIDTRPTFNEFAVRLPIHADEACARMTREGFLAGLPLAALGAGGPNDLLIAVTEQRTRPEMDAFASALRRSCA